MGAEDLAAQMTHNAAKAAEHGSAGAQCPPTGAHLPVPDSVVTASTVQEHLESDKLGRHPPALGHNANTGSLAAVRVDSTGQHLTTNQGVAIADNQNSLKAGLRGPSLLEDFILREKLTHFDHERIPERVVHARGSGAHGYFECDQPVPHLTRANLFSEAGRRTPVFVRFSTVAGERGSADTVRDTRGFAVKFYTDEGNWDLVGNNIPVFFIQDAMKFPDVVHAVKPEPHHQMPQASSAHDTFWDFVSLMPESIHHVMWVMSDRGIPRSYRMMQGFGVNTYRFVNARNESVFVKFHWLPLAGTHSLVWDEAVKIAGADPDYHRRDLWESIEAGVWPEYELAVQTFTEEMARQFSFDVLDATKLVPEELVPLQVLGRLVLNRNPDNFFAETEQVAFCAAHVVPGIDFSDDPLLQGRIHSYVDTQLTRLGGPNFHEIPINAPLAPVHNHQRDGMHRQAIHRGRVAYEPHSLGGGCPHQAGVMGFVSVAERIEPPKLRAKPEKFADHYTQARLFWRSQLPVEQRHIIAAFRFELSRVTVAAIRERVVSMLCNVDDTLASAVAEGLALPLPPPQPMAVPVRVESEVDTSPALSLFARPGDGSVRGRRVALLAAPPEDGRHLATVQAALSAAQAMPCILSGRFGALPLHGGSALAIESTVEAQPSALWDAVVVSASTASLGALRRDGRILEFLRDQYRHGKPILVLSEHTEAVDLLGLSTGPGVACATAPDKASVNDFLQTLAAHRSFDRETDPPRI